MASNLPYIIQIIEICVNIAGSADKNTFSFNLLKHIAFTVTSSYNQ